MEQMDEKTILDIDRQGDVPNCAATIYRSYEHEGVDQSTPMQLVQANFLAPLREAATPVTVAADVPAAPKP